MLGHLPTKHGTLFNYVLDTDNRVWRPWQVPKYVHDPGQHFSDILVPTVDTVRSTWFLHLMNEWKKPVVLVGETGTSKTAVVQQFLKDLDRQQFVRDDQRSG